MHAITVLVVDDDPEYLRVLEGFLRTHGDLDVVGRAADGGEAAGQYVRLQPDVVVMDAYMPNLDGLWGTRAIKAHDPDARVIVLTAHDGAELRAHSVEAGASAFVPKQDAPHRLVEEIRRVASA